MIRYELRNDRCFGCGASLNRAAYVGREDVVYVRGEFAGEHGIVILAECSCGLTSVVPLSVSPRKAA